MKKFVLNPFLLVSLLLAQAAVLSHGQTSSVHEVEVNGSRGKRINMVFLSEGYKSDQMGLFATHVQGAVDYLFTREPWSRYRSYFNIYRIEVASVDSGTDYGYEISNDPDGPQGPELPVVTVAKQSRNTYFSSGFNTPTSTNLMTVGKAGSDLAYGLLNKHVPEYDIPIMLVNEPRYGGSGGPIALASADEYSVEILEHEIGHSFAKLTDEYDFNIPGYPATEQINATTKTQRSQVRWQQWIDNDTLLPTPEGPDFQFTETVGLFEGAHYRTSGWYRPHDNALMKWLGLPPGAVTREAIVLAYYSKISPLEGFSPVQKTLSATTRQSFSFSVDVKTPSTGEPVLVTWKIDGTPVATGPSFTIASQDMGFDGKHKVTAEVYDNTPWVRRDPGGLMKASVSWDVTLDNQNVEPSIHGTPENVLVEVGQPFSLFMDARGPVPGQVQFEWSRDGKVVAKSNSGVLAVSAAKLTDGGAYKVKVTGGDYSAQFNAAVTVVDPKLQTLVLPEGKAATLVANVKGPVNSYEWLRGDTVIQAAGVATAKLVLPAPMAAADDGSYKIRLTTPAGPAQTFHQYDVAFFNRAPALDTATTNLPVGRVGAPYGPHGGGFQVKVQAVTGGPVAAFSATGLPPGLKINPATGWITGIPTAAKVDKLGNPLAYLVTLTAKNGKGSVKTTTLLLIQPLPAGSVGSFIAVVPRGENAYGLTRGLGGRLDLSTLANGSFSGKVVLGEATYSFKGLLTSAPGSSLVTGSTAIPIPGSPSSSPILLNFTLDSGSKSIVGSITLGAETLSLSGWFNPWSKTVQADAYDGYYTASLDLPEVDPAYFEIPVEFRPPLPPTGSGLASFSVSVDGKATVAGKTPDGETFTSAGFLGSKGELMVFSLQKGNPQGSIVGAFTLGDLNDADDSNNIIVGDSSTVTWWKPASDDPKTRIYRYGLEPISVTVRGGRYQETSFPFVEGSDVELGFSWASLESRLAAEVIMQAKGKAVVQAPLAGATLTINPKLGTFTGKLTRSDVDPRDPEQLARLSRQLTFEGIIYRKDSLFTGHGYFLLPDLPYWEWDTPTSTDIQSGFMELGVQK